MRAGLEAVAYQTADLLDALAPTARRRSASLLVDGGLTANSWAMQFLADICDVEVARPTFQEVTALGAAKLAALRRRADRRRWLPRGGQRTRWSPRMSEGERARSARRLARRGERGAGRGGACFRRGD